MPALRGRLAGICVYAPTAEASFIELTVRLNTSGPGLYKDICHTLDLASQGSLKGVLGYLSRGAGGCASGEFAGADASAVVDAGAGRQVSTDTVKLALWFDNETGVANRVVDLALKAYELK